MVDYSKWDHIEVSDDEDDIHPNVDTPSLFRWRHQARVDRMGEQKQERETFMKESEQHKTRKDELKRLMEQAEEEGGENVEERIAKLKLEMGELEKQEDHFRQKEAELLKKERLTPWNVDTLSSEGFEKTIINPAESSEKPKSDDDIGREFWDANEKDIKHYGMLRDYDSSSEFLRKKPHLVCEATANYLTIWCITLECQEKHDLMSHVARQTIVMQYILELGKQIRKDPRDTFLTFFKRIKMADKQYVEAMDDEHQALIGRVEERAKIRLKAIEEEIEEEERQKRLGPGGLDPVEVYESLPQEMKDCFEKKDTGLLQDVLKKLDPTLAKYHMKRCIDSGMWVPDGNTSAAVEEDEKEGKDGHGEERK
eukprot:m.176762 g.176762  ORF g.176762 m.176762 type:complete len:368 (+) comp39146_c1_seq1:1942-3045(+)